MKNICVYASASDNVDKKYFEVAEKLGILLGRRGYNLVFGGGTVGLMGACARGFHKENRKVISVIPEFLKLPGVYYEESDEVYVTESVRKRKRIMEDLSEGFLVLPGGYGTYEELMEIVTLKQLGRHKKPVAVVNSFGFYNKLQGIFRDLVKENFTQEKYLELCYFADNEEKAVEYVVNYQFKEIEPKWGKKKDEKKKNKRIRREIGFL